MRASISSPKIVFGSSSKWPASVIIHNYVLKINMKKCKNCLEMYGHDHPPAGLGEFKMFGDYCPYCGSFNSDFNKDSFIALVIAAIFFVIIYFIIIN